MRFFVKTMGCKTNLLEGQLIIQDLLEEGFEQSSNIEEADFYILNSCTVTQKSDNEAIYFLRQAKRKNPKIKTVLTGCMAQVAENDLPEGIDIVLGNNEKLDISKYLKCEHKVCDIFSLKEFNNKFVKNLSTTRANIKIQDGCNARCSYCIIPFARGNSRSNKLQNIIEQIEMLAEKGFKEVIFTGIHIGQFGLDLDPELNLRDLVYFVEKTPIERFRLGSLTPDEITPELIEILAESKKFCPHFHLSLQSASDKVLRSMNRTYTTEYYLNVIATLNKVFKNPFLGADIITGFPTETVEDFDQTFKNLSISNLSKIHVFPYSQRKGTEALNFPHHVDEIHKHERSKVLCNLSDKLHQKFLEKNMGEKAEVLFEKKRNSKGKLKGLTRNYIEVITGGPDEYKNTLSNVTLNPKSIENGCFII